MFNVGWVVVFLNLAKHDLEFYLNQPLLTTQGNGPDPSFFQWQLVAGC